MDEHLEGANESPDQQPGPPLSTPFLSGISGGSPDELVHAPFRNLGNTCYIAVAVRMLLLQPETTHPLGWWQRLDAL